MKKTFKYIGISCLTYCRWISKQATSFLNAIFILTLTSQIGGIAGSILLLGILILGGYEWAVQENRNLLVDKLSTDFHEVIDSNGIPILIAN